MNMYVFGNWKMYLDFDESCILMSRFLEKEYSQDLQLSVFPSMLALSEVEKLTRDSDWQFGAQNIAWVEKGAYTGAISAQMVADAGASYALVGHSERRYIFGETNDATNKKIKACLEAGITPVLCIGETQEDKENDKRQYRLTRQLQEALEGIDVAAAELIVAYEPVWAIGTGDACLPADAEDVIGWIKNELGDESVPVLYGGSVDAQNVVSYTSQSSIDGVLVGGCSAKFEEFDKLLRALEN